MQTVGIDIGTTTISGVALEKNGTQKPRILKAKTIENKYNHCMLVELKITKTTV